MDQERREKRAKEKDQEEEEVQSSSITTPRVLGDIYGVLVQKEGERIKDHNINDASVL